MTNARTSDECFEAIYFAVHEFENSLRYKIKDLQMECPDFQMDMKCEKLISDIELAKKKFGNEA